MVLTSQGLVLIKVIALKILSKFIDTSKSTVHKPSVKVNSSVNNYNTIGEDYEYDSDDKIDVSNKQKVRI